MRFLPTFTAIGILFIICLTAAVGQSHAKLEVAGSKNPEGKSVIIFIELGSVNCIPCRQMQPVMKAIEEKYAGQVKVIFYDVLKEDQRGYAEKYGIRVIPTQVFLDKTGKEFFRHEGFYPEAEIDKLLQTRGLKVQAGG